MRTTSPQCSNETIPSVDFSEKTKADLAFFCDARKQPDKRINLKQTKSGVEHRCYGPVSFIDDVYDLDHQDNQRRKFHELVQRIDE